MSKTGIQWTDETWNPVTGCDKISQGCKNCYAEKLHTQRFKFNERIRADFPGQSTAQIREHSPRLLQPATYDTPFTTVVCHPERLREPLGWRKPKRVFTCSMGDLFHEDVPDAFLDQVFAVMAITPHITYQVLTKRPERMRAYHATTVFHRFPLPNVWLGTSVENQEAADLRIPDLLATPATVRFLSCEPLIGPVRLAWALAGLQWVIVGGESGAGARPCDVEWVRDIVRQCRAAGVAPFVKQLGSKVSSDGGPVGHGFNWPTPPDANHLPLWRREGETYYRKLKHNHGGNIEEWPEDLRVREFPGVAR